MKTARSNKRQPSRASFYTIPLRAVLPPARRTYPLARLPAIALRRRSILLNREAARRDHSLPRGAGRYRRERGLSRCLYNQLNCGWYSAFDIYAVAVQERTRAGCELNNLLGCLGSVGKLHPVGAPKRIRCSATYLQ